MRLVFWRKAPTDTPSPTRPKRWTWLGGRRILTNTPYVLPKDKEEGDRLDIQHHLFKLAAGGLYLAPLHTIRLQNILDVACGTGIWGREMAQAFPNARVIGFDIDRSLPERAIELLGPAGQFPPNFRFQVADALQPFPFADGEFEFVHARLISPFVPIARWLDVVREMLRVLKRGGYLEIVEYETLAQSPSPAFNRLGSAFVRLLDQRGLYAGVGDMLPSLLAQAGASHIQQRKFVLGQGKSESETKRQQRLLAADMLAAQAHIRPIFTKLGFFSEAEFDALDQQSRWELPQLGVVWPVVFCYGQKL